jgi:hypothetical protein
MSRKRETKISLEVYSLSDIKDIVWACDGVMQSLDERGGA